MNNSNTPSERMVRQGAAVADIYHPPVEPYDGHAQDALFRIGSADWREAPPRWGLKVWAMVAIGVAVSLGALLGMWWG